MRCSWKRRGVVFPGILHVDADIVVPFDLDALHLEIEIAAGNLHHALGRGGGRSVGCDLDQFLRHVLPFMRVAG